MPSHSEFLFKRYGPPSKIKYPPKPVKPIKRTKARGTKQRLKAKLAEKEALIKDLYETLKDEQAAIRGYVLQLEYLSAEKQRLEDRVNELASQGSRAVHLAEQALLDAKNKLLLVDLEIGQGLNQLKQSALDNLNSNH